MIRSGLVMALLAGPAAAQGYSDAQGGILRWLDKLTGETADIELVLRQEAVSGRLTIRLDACRYPDGQPDLGRRGASDHSGQRGGNAGVRGVDGGFFARAFGAGSSAL
jgi:hypothetical protein